MKQLKLCFVLLVVLILTERRMEGLEVLSKDERQLVVMINVSQLVNEYKTKEIHIKSPPSQTK